MNLPKGQYHPIRLIYKNILRLLTPQKSKSKSTVSIEVLIPVAEKDIGGIYSVVKSIRTNIINPIRNIFIVGKPGPLESISNELQCIFIDEDSILPIKKQDIIFNGKEWHRSGWLFQQFIKLNAGDVAEGEYILVIDADTCITKPQSFVLDDQTFVLNFADEYHHPYSRYKNFLGLNKRFYLSFVCHHMLLSRLLLNNLKKDIEDFTGENWIQGILKNIDFNESCCFSEYETYGNYVYFNYTDKCHLEYWNNRSVKNVEQVISAKGNYKTMSFHKYS